MNLFSKLKHEAKEVGLVTSYFFFCFGVMMTMKQLLLADYRIEVQVLSTAAISALIIAKIVAILDHTSVGKRFDTCHPLWLAVLYKTMVYLVLAFIVFFLEKLFHAYHEMGLLNLAMSEVWEHRNRNLILMKLLSVGLTFLGYHFYAGLDRRLGEGALRRMIFERPEST